MDQQKALDDLTFIRQMMADSQTIIRERTLDFMVWGILITIGLLGTYFGILFKFYREIGMWMWISIVAIGWIFAFTRGSFKKGHAAPTLAGKMMKGTWLAVGIAVTIFGFIAPWAGAIEGPFISPVIATTIAIAYYLSGILYQKKWVTYLAFYWWAGAIGMFFFPRLEVLLFMAFLLITGQIIPGIILYREALKAE